MFIQKLTLWEWKDDNDNKVHFFSVEDSAFLVINRALPA